MCRLKDATHVVTSTTTGFNAYMLFEKESKSSSEKQVIEGSFKLAMNSMGVLDVNAEASAKLSNEEKEVLKTLKFKFYGDTIIDPPPANYDDAIQAYKNLPSLAKTSKKVLSFNLSPLSAFCSQTDDIIIGIDDSNVEAVSKIFEDFDSFEEFSSIFASLLFAEVESFPSLAKLFSFSVPEVPLLEQLLLPLSSDNSRSSETTDAVLATSTSLSLSSPC